jgi:hypothetical protein
VRRDLPDLNRPRLRVIEEVELPELGVDDVDGVHVLRQDFEVPEGALPVRMQTGDLPVTIIGWVDGGRGSMQGLLRSVADELDTIEAAQDADEPAGS